MSEEAARLTEVIVVNDGSTDCTGEILKNYRQAGRQAGIPLIVIEKENGGLSSARNAGLDAACGRYVFFVDSDDYLTDGSVEKLICFLVDCDADVVEFNGYFNIDGSIKSSIRDARAVGVCGKGQKVWANLQKQSCFDVMVWLRCVSRELLILNELYFLEGIIHEDEEWTPRVFSYADNVTYLDDYIYVYRQRSGSIMASPKTHKNFVDMIKILDSLTEFAQKQHLSGEFSRGLLNLTSDMYFETIKGIKRGNVYDIELISELEKRLSYAHYSSKFNRKYFYRYFIHIFGLKAFYVLKYHH